MKRVVLFVIGIFISGIASAQCAMCRATLENNLSNGELEVGSTLNFGILYLFVAPYLAIGLISFFWYRQSRANAGR